MYEFGHLYEVGQGSVIICVPGQLIEVSMHASDGPGLYLLYFEMGEMVSVTAEVLEQPSHKPKFSLIGEVPVLPASLAVEWCEMIYEHWYAVDRIDRFRSQAGLHELLRLILKKPKSDPYEALHCAKQIIEERYSEALTIEQLSEIAGMSRYHFMRMFKLKYKKSAIDYMTELRLNRAKQLMLQQDQSLLQIAYQVGYMNE